MMADMEKTKTNKRSKKKKTAVERVMFALVRVRGKVHLREDISDTMKFLNLTRINHCVVIDNREQYKGMINKAKDYITWGEINEEVLGKLLGKRARLTGNKKLTEDYLAKNTECKSIEELSEGILNFKVKIKDVPELKPVFRLSPPSKGYERGGIKHPYSTGGALGYRGEKINELLEKMI